MDQLPPGAPERLAAYADLVRRWSDRLDLVAPGDLPRFEQRHIDDALRAVPLLDSLPPGVCADVGSGAGVPGIPLAIARPERRWRLLEPRARRAAFLEEAVRDLGLDCEVLLMTAERAAAEAALAGAHLAVTARALAPPAAAPALLMPLVSSSGVAVLWLGRSAALPPGAEEWGDGLAIIRGGSPTEAEE